MREKKREKGERERARGRERERRKREKMQTQWLVGFWAFTCKYSGFIVSLRANVY